jgi:hypothetical protein
MEITVILHTPAGDVRTAFHPNAREHAMKCIESYTLDGKSFSVEQRKF